MSNPITETNEKLCQMLGIKGTDRITAVNIRLRPNRYPQITVSRMVRSAGELEELTQTFRLEPAEPEEQEHVGAADGTAKTAVAGDKLEA